MDKKWKSNQPDIYKSEPSKFYDLLKFVVKSAVFFI